MSDFSNPYVKALLDEAIHNSATNALGLRIVPGPTADPWQILASPHSAYSAYSASEAARRAMANVELARQMTAMQHMGRDMEAMRQLARDMEAMGQVTREVEAMRQVREMEAMWQVTRDREEMRRVTRDIGIVQQNLANGIRQEVVGEIARVVGVQKEIADVLSLRQHERDKSPKGTPQGNTNDAVDPRAEAKRKVVEIPPGATLLAWAQAWCSAKTVELVIEPIIADYRHEIFEALSHGWSKGAIRAIHVRYRFSFFEAIVRTVVGMVGRIIKAARGV